MTDHVTEHETPDMKLAREKHAAAVDPHETPDQKVSREKRGHLARRARKSTAATEENQ